MTSEVTTIKSPKVVKSATHHYVDIKEVPDLIARVMQNDLHINELATKKANNSAQH